MINAIKRRKESYCDGCDCSVRMTDFQRQETSLCCLLMSVWLCWGQVDLRNNVHELYFNCAVHHDYKAIISRFNDLFSGFKCIFHVLWRWQCVQTLSERCRLSANPVPPSLLCHLCSWRGSLVWLMKRNAIFLTHTRSHQQAQVFTSSLVRRLCRLSLIFFKINIILKPNLLSPTKTRRK